MHTCPNPYGFTQHITVAKYRHCKYKLPKLTLWLKRITSLWTRIWKNYCWYWTAKQRYNSLWGNEHSSSPPFLYPPMYLKNNNSRVTETDIHSKMLTIWILAPRGSTKEGEIREERERHREERAHLLWYASFITLVYKTCNVCISRSTIEGDWTLLIMNTEHHTDWPNLRFLTSGSGMIGWNYRDDIAVCREDRNSKFFLYGRTALLGNV